jgi:NitT/TauT family transport system permease protein
MKEGGYLRSAVGSYAGLPREVPSYFECARGLCLRAFLLFGTAIALRREWRRAIRMAFFQQQVQAQPVPGGSVKKLTARTAAQLASLVPATLMLALMVVAWALVAHFRHLQSFVLPGPTVVLSNLVDLLRDGTLVTNGLVTLEEAALGLAVAVVVALPLGYALARVRFLERLFAPLLAASQAIPVVAVAPLLVIWLDTGISLKVVVSAVIVVFPLTVNTMTATRGIAIEYLEVAQIFGVPWWERVARVELPLAAPVMLAGLKVGVALSLTGAVVGEFVAGDRGLGFLIGYYRDNLYTAGSFATLVVLVAMGISLFSLVSMLERIVARWQE